MQDEVRLHIDALMARPLDEIRTRLPELDSPGRNNLIAALRCDDRLGARKLAERLAAESAATTREASRLARLHRFERVLWSAGLPLIAGVDEAGISPLAGPVVAGACILPKNYSLTGLDDSKKIHSSSNRSNLAETIKNDAIAWSTGSADVSEIETLNVYHAGLLAMQRAVDALAVVPDFVLVDAHTIPACCAPQRGIIRGDSLSASIAAASIIAKTTRDAIMVTLAAAYPGYGFDANKGYPTPAHRAHLMRLGPSPLHRRRFAIVADAARLFVK